MVEQHEGQKLQGELQAALSQSMQAAPNAQSIWLGVSGGLDSSVLLHAAASLEHWRPKLRVVHVNHQLSPWAEQWQAAVEQQAKALEIPCVSAQVQVVPSGKGIEEAARQARLLVFAAQLAPGDALLLAHHQNDQAETLLLRLLRGAGLTGLGAMSPVRPLGAGLLLRPFLNLPQAQLAAYAQAFGLSWVDDESNQSWAFDRNYLRGDILPRLHPRWPKAQAQMAAAAQRLREDEALLSGYLRAELQQLAPRQETWGHSLPLAPLVDWQPHKRHSVIRLWLAELGLSVPQQIHLAELDKLLPGRPDASPCVAFGGCELRLYQQRLYAMPALPPLAANWQSPWRRGESLALPPGSFLAESPEQLGLPPGEYQLRLRQGGERCRPWGRAHSQTLKKLLQEAGIPPWLRDRIPLVYQGDRLLAVGNLWRNHCEPENEVS